VRFTGYRAEMDGRRTIARKTLFSCPQNAHHASLGRSSWEWTHFGARLGQATLVLDVRFWQQACHSLTTRCCLSCASKADVRGLHERLQAVTRRQLTEAGRSRAPAPIVEW